MTVWGRMFGSGFTVTLESIVAKRKQRAARGLRDEEDPPAGAPSLFQGLITEMHKLIVGENNSQSASRPTVGVPTEKIPNYCHART